MYGLSVDDEVYISLHYDDHQMIFGPAGLGIYYMVTSADLAGKDIFFYISYSFDGVLAEQHRRLDVFCHLGLYIFNLDYKTTKNRNMDQMYRCLDQKNELDSTDFVLILRLEI